MAIFSSIYQVLIRWSKHPKAPYYLALVSVIEAIFFPIPVDVMLMLMSLAKPKRCWFYATITTLSSVFGGLIGYALGSLLIQWVYPLLVEWGYQTAYETALAWFDTWGIGIIFLASFTPIPYKVFTIAAGAAHMAFFPFALTSLVGRGLRFFLVAGSIGLSKGRLHTWLLKYIDWIGWITVGAFFLWMLIGCQSVQMPAPLHEAWESHLTPSKAHRVREGDTLYAIAWYYEKEFKTLAELNHLSSPYTLKTGQWIQLKGHIRTEKKPIKKKKATPVMVHHSSLKPLKASKWHWPVKGPILRMFSEKKGSKGIDIAGKKGTPIQATADGQVVYSGHGLRGYGNLVIIKHNNDYLSAYAHNQHLFVKEGDSVTSKQRIANMGSTEAKRPLLHFEIRHKGKPIDPLVFLKN